MVVMGRVLAPYGVAGWIKVEAYSAAPDALLEYEEWGLRGPGAGAWRMVPRVAGRVHGDLIVARLQGIDDRDQALTLRGHEIGVPRASMPEAGADEVYWSDLVGCVVVNREGVVLGEVKDVTAHGAHPLLVVQRADGERLIPYVEAVIDAVDVPQRRIEADWAEDW